MIASCDGGYYRRAVKVKPETGPSKEASCVYMATPKRMLKPAMAGR